MQRTRGVSLGLALVCFVAIASSARAQSGDEARLLVSEAREAIADKEYKRAGRLLDRAIAINPRRVDAYVLRSTVYTVYKQYDKGIALLRRAQRLAPNNLDVLNALGSQLVLAGKYEEGVPILERVVERQPRRYQAHALLAHHYIRTATWARAETALEAYLDTRPKHLRGSDATYTIDLADAKLRLGKADGALGLFDKVLGKDADNVRALMGRAWALAAIDCRKAMPVFRQLGKLGKTYPEIWLVWGHCSLMVGKLDRAVDLASRYTKRRPASAGGHALLGGAHASRGDLGAARKSMQRAIELEPGEHLYVIKLARLDRQAGEPRVAAARLSTGARPEEGDPSWLPWHVEWGKALIDDGKPAEAVELAGRIVAAKSDSPDAQLLFGDALRRTGDYPRAIAALEAAIGLDANFGEAKSLLIEVFNDAAENGIGEGNLEDAEKLLVRADAVGANRRTWGNLALVRIRRGDHAGALQPLEKLEDKDARSAHMHGHALGVLGKLEESEVVLKKALDLAGGDAARKRRIGIDLAASQVALGAPERAVATLQPLIGEKGDAVAQAFVVASRAEATEHMLAGRYGRAVRTLEDAEKQLGKGDADARVAVQCDLALAFTAARQRSKAQSALRDLEKDKAVCPFPAPADKLAVPILLAINEGMDARYGSRSLRTLAKMRKAATGVAGKLLEEGMAIVAMRAAAAAHARGRTSTARKYLNTADDVVRGRDPYLLHNRAVLDLESGKLDSAITVLTRVADDVPEALVNLGIAYDRKGDAAAAVRYYRRAKARLKSAEVDEWIAAKEYVYGPDIGR